jgi:hypothetical protein
MEHFFKVTEYNIESSPTWRQTHLQCGHVLPVSNKISSPLFLPATELITPP